MAWISKQLTLSTSSVRIACIILLVFRTLHGASYRAAPILSVRARFFQNRFQGGLPWPRGQLSITNKGCSRNICSTSAWWCPLAHWVLTAWGQRKTCLSAVQREGRRRVGPNGNQAVASPTSSASSVHKEGKPRSLQKARTSTGQFSGIGRILEMWKSGIPS